MENGLQISENSRGAVQLSSREMAICTTLNTFNQLRDFKLNDVEIVEWMESINELAPDAEPEMIRYAITAMMQDRLEYDRHIGIQNIFRALKRIRKTETGYEILKPVW